MSAAEGSGGVSVEQARSKRAKRGASKGETVTEIAAACGYADAAHFCHACKAAGRLTPKQFRDRARA